MVRKIALVAAGVLLLGVGPTRADEAVVEQMYGNGVHAYFSGDMSRAYDSLTAAIRGGSHDPRVYYFRALAESRLGREQDAVTDFQRGADYEAAAGNGDLVSRALERIQGSTRATLEQYRENARAVALQHPQPTQSSGGPVVMRRETAEPVPPPDLGSAKPPAGVAGPGAAKAGPAKPADAMPDKAAADKTPDAADPFSSDAGKNPATAPVVPPPDKPADDPFNSDAGKKPAAAPVVPPPDKSGDDPFNSDTKPADKPADKPAAKSAEKTAEKAGAAADDPFNSNPKPAVPPAEKPIIPPPDKPAVPPADAKSPPAGKTAAVKPEPGAARGVLNALNFGGALTNTFANIQQAAVGALQGRGGAPAGATASATAPAAIAPPAKPTLGPAPAAGPADDPFAAPAVATKPAAPASDAATTAPASTVAPPADAASAPAAKKSSDPFADEPAPKAVPAPKAAPAAKPAGKDAPEMKKDDDPFKV